MLKFFKENIVLALGISLPLLLVLVFMLSSAIPGWFVDPPRYDVLFTHTSYNTPWRFETVNGRLQLRFIPDQATEQSAPVLYRYVAATGKVERVNFTLPERPQIPPARNPAVNINANINIPVDPAKPPTAEQARAAGKLVAEIQQGAPQPAVLLFPVAELAALPLDSNPDAPDGYNFVSGTSGYYRGDFFWNFGSGYRDGKTMLVKSGKSVPIPFRPPGPDYYRTATFVAWVVP